MKQGIAMLLRLSKIIETPDSVLPFETALDLHELQFGGSCPVQEPVLAKGTVRNKAGVLLEGGDSLFVGNAKGYVRLNLAMPRAIIQTGLERMRDAIRKERTEH